jgi:hypothetical protein
MRTLLLALAVLSGCASRPYTEITLRWIELGPVELTQACNLGGQYPKGVAEKGLYGCARKSLGVCYIYIAPLAHHKSEADYHDTIGEEVRHCRDGRFHGASKGVPVDQPRKSLGGSEKIFW